MNKDITLEDLGYIKDENHNCFVIEKYMSRIGIDKLEFYENGILIEDTFLTYADFYAIYNKCKELGVVR